MIKVGDTTVTAVYRSARAPLEENRKLLENVTPNGNGNLVVVGDLNTRHPNWDRSYSVRGQRLMESAETDGWHIDSCSEPTCTTRNEKGTPDVFMTKRLEIDKIEQIQGAWEEVKTTDNSQQEQHWESQ